MTRSQNYVAGQSGIHLHCRARALSPRAAEDHGERTLSASGADTQC